MKEKLLLTIVWLSGWYIFSACFPRQYHYVGESKTWSEAQVYCREKYTDLATMDNMEDMNQLINTVQSYDHSNLFWIGVYIEINWKWSLADESYYPDGGAEYRNWESIEDDEPDYRPYHFCVNVKNNGRWWDDNCLSGYPFICYNGETIEGSNYVIVNERKTWSSAQRYCRENFVDLASVRNQTVNEEIQNLVPKGDWAWIGLYREPQSWSDGSNSSFSYWDDSSNPVTRPVRTKKCVAASSNKSEKWIQLSCTDRLPFVCYSTDTESKHVFKLKLNLEDSSVDLNDPAVKADILRQLQNRLKDKELSGAVLKWQEQPDGKVFHKEEKRQQDKEKRNKQRKREL